MAVEGPSPCSCLILPDLIPILMSNGLVQVRPSLQMQTLEAQALATDNGKKVQPLPVHNLALIQGTVQG